MADPCPRSNIREEGGGLLLSLFFEVVSQVLFCFFAFY
jgi:hypothetical protein